MDSAAAIAEHEKAGTYFEAAGVRSFVRDEGDGEPVVCMHGVPASSFLYRHLLRELASRGLRGVAFDLPGLGLAERPPDFDYTWTGLGRFATAAIAALELGRFHLVVHDLGGPVGFEVASALPDRVRSLTILNTMIEVDSFRRPWVMQPFAWRFVGEIWLAAVRRPVFVALMRWQGMQDRTVPAGEIAAYLELLKRGDNGRAFLKIMRGFERTAAKRRLYESAVQDVPYPVQVVWGANDPALTLRRYGRQAARATGLNTIHTVPGKHFLAEDQAPAIAKKIAALVRRPDAR